MKLKLCFIVTSLFILGCDDATPPTTTTVNIEEVIQHQPGIYSFLIRENTNEIRAVTLTDYGVSYWESPDCYKIFDDVPANKHMYVDIKSWDGTFERKGSAEIHIHSLANISTGEYETNDKARTPVNTIIIGKVPDHNQ